MSPGGKVLGHVHQVHHVHLHSAEISLSVVSHLRKIPVFYIPVFLYRARGFCGRYKWTDL